MPIHNEAKKKTCIGPWLLGETLGKGSTSRVRRAKHSVTGQMAAVKIVSTKSMDQSISHLTTKSGNKIPLCVESEITVMKLFRHPNIVNLYDVWKCGGDL